MWLSTGFQRELLSSKQEKKMFEIDNIAVLSTNRVLSCLKTTPMIVTNGQKKCLIHLLQENNNCNNCLFIIYMVGQTCLVFAAFGVQNPCMAGQTCHSHD